jgi:hypothetical protein
MEGYMKKKKIFLTASLISLFTLASCVANNSNNSNGLDRGTTDSSDNNITIPDAIRPSIQNDKPTYTVIHKLENKSGNFETFYTEVKEANDEGNTEALNGQTVTINVAFGENTLEPVDVVTEGDGTFHAEIATNGNYGEATITTTYAGEDGVYLPAEETATTNVIQSTILFISGDRTEFSQGLQGSGFLQVNEETDAGNGASGNSANGREIKQDAAAGTDGGIKDATIIITAVYAGHQDQPVTFDVTTEDDGSFSFTRPVDFDDFTGNVDLTAEFEEDGVYAGTTATASEPAVITEDEPKVT